MKVTHVCDTNCKVHSDDFCFQDNELDHLSLIQIFFWVVFSDKVEFGETVHAPPLLSVRPKKAEVSQNVDRVRAILLKYICDPPVENQDTVKLS